MSSALTTGETHKFEVSYWAQTDFDKTVIKCVKCGYYPAVPRLGYFDIVKCRCCGIHNLI